MRRSALSLLLLLVPVLWSSAPAAAQVSGSVSAPCPWQFQIGGDQVNLTYPDAGARYWGGTLPLLPGTYIEFRGEFPRSRYFSLATYDPKSAAIDGLADAAINPDPGSTNPFRPGADRTTSRRAFTARLVNERVPASGRAPNTLYNESADGSRSARAFNGAGLGLRIYEPDAGTGDTGGVRLPQATLVLADGTRVALGGRCQTLKLPDVGTQPLLAGAGEGIPAWGPGLLAPAEVQWRRYTNAPNVLAGLVLDNDLTADTYTALRETLEERVPSGGFFENPDNKYVTALTSREHGQVLVLEGRLPTTPSTRYGDERMGTGQLRYWSLCTFSQASSLYDCVTDEDVPVGGDRRFTIALSTAAARPANARPACGVAWLPLGPHPQTMLMLRNMLPAPGFTEAIQRVAVGNEREEMGDHYPRGTYLRTSAAFERRGCSRTKELRSFRRRAPGRSRAAIR